MGLKKFVLGGLTGLVLITAGCENDNNSGDSPQDRNSVQSSSKNNSSGWGIKHYSSTDVNPEPGRYAFSATGSFNVKTNDSGATLRFSRDGYAFYSISLKNGTFYYKNGCLVGSNDSSSNGNLYPTDGFAISGHFTSPTAAEGTIVYAYSGRVTARSDFIATK